MADLCNKPGEEIIPPEYPSGDCACNLIAGANITIEETSEGTVISAVGGGIGYIAGDGITIDGGTISIDCEELMDCEGLVEMENEIQGKQPILTAGDHISIVQNEISATFTKAELLQILGVTEIPITMTDVNGNTVSVTVLGVRNNG